MGDLFTRLQLAIVSTDSRTRSAEIDNHNDLLNFGPSDVGKMPLYI